MADLDLARDEYGHGCFAIDLDGQRQGYVPSIRDRLIARGVLHCVDGVWRLAWHGFDLDREKAADMSCCDFCSARPVTWLCPCTSFEMPQHPGGASPTAISHGDWAACDPCGLDISSRNKAALLTRAQAVGPPGIDLASLPREFRRLLRDIKTELHQRFWRHYQGGAVRIPPHPHGH